MWSRSGQKTQKFILRSALRPNQISFSHSLGQKRECRSPRRPPRTRPLYLGKRTRCSSIACGRFDSPVVRLCYCSCYGTPSTHPLRGDERRTLSRDWPRGDARYDKRSVASIVKHRWPLGGLRPIVRSSMARLVPQLGQNTSSQACRRAGPLGGSADHTPTNGQTLDSPIRPPPLPIVIRG